MKKKLFACIFLVLSLAVLVAEESPSSVPASNEDDILKIGVAGAHSGPLATYGLPSVRAAQLVVDKYNRNGGLLGRHIELVYRDDQCKPQNALVAAKALVEAGVVGVVGHICSGATKSALDVYSANDLICISPSATVSDLTQNGDNPWFFRTIPPEFDMSRVLVDYIANLEGSPSLAILADRGGYGTNTALVVRDLADTRGIPLVLFEGVDQGVPNCLELVEHVRESGADIVVWSGYHQEGAQIVMQMRQLGMDNVFIAGDGVYDKNFIQAAGAYAEGVLAVGPKEVSSNPLAVEAAAECLERYGEAPGPFFYNAYAACEALFAAIKRARSTEAAAIRKALHNHYVETPLGDISFNTAGDVIGYGFTTYRVENGAFKDLEK